MRKILVIMAIICGCTWFGGYVEAKDYTFKIINNSKKSITQIRVNNSSKPVDILFDSSKTGQVTPSDQQDIISSVDLKVDGAWSTLSFDGWSQYSTFEITLSLGGNSSVVGRN